jgi:hypothetical protein
MNAVAMKAAMNHAAVTPPPLWDTLLRRAPVHVFLFDRDLVCRYAAPVACSRGYSRR